MILQPMHSLTVPEGLTICALFGVAMLALVVTRIKTERGAEGFLVADRVVPMWQAAFSIAVSWVWAPAIFVCSMQAYKLGLPGIFWFTVPNVLCFFIFAPLARRLRDLSPQGFTLPEFIGKRFDNDKLPHLAFLIGFLLNMTGAIVANAYAGGALLNQLTGIETEQAILIVSGIALSYSLISGLKASIFTDVIQMFMVLGLALILVPSVIFSLDDGPATLMRGFGGRDGNHWNIFDPSIAFTIGIPMSITLLTGPLADQMFIQRSLAVRHKDIIKTFVFGGLLFGLIPITLSLLGFVAAALAQDGLLVVNNAEMVGPLVIAHTLPKIAMYAFTFMALAALCSTLDSALCAASSLGSVDIYRRYIKAECSDTELCKKARLAMISISIIGTSIALFQPSMLWTFLVSGCITGSLFFPTIFALYAKNITAKTIFWAVLLSLSVSIPFSVYANINEQPLLVVLSSLSSVVIGFSICAASTARKSLPS